MENNIKKINKKILIQVSNLYKSFDTEGRITRILKNVSLTINSGDFVVIFGPSGCGKSTLLHAITGLEKPDAGDVKLGGIDLWRLNTEDRSNIRKHEIGIMYQAQNWIKSLNVVENIAFPSQLTGLEKEKSIEKASEMLRLMGMEDRKTYSPSELSAGEQQKIGLARALITDPKVLVSDEPTGNLDLRSGQEMMDLFSKMNKAGKTIIMVTHNPDYLKYSNKTVLMLDGKIVKEIEVSSTNAAEIEKEISQDLKTFINEKVSSSVDERIYPKIIKKEEEVEKTNILNKLEFSATFILKFIFQSIFFSIYFLLKFLSKFFSKFKDYTLKFKERFAKLSRKLERNLDKRITGSINSIDLTEISFKNLLTKKSRSTITVIGMSVGIGFIVFLLSLGYGLERLVLNEVTRIQDKRQIDIMPTISSNVFLDKENVDLITKISGVEKTLPLVNLAGKASLGQSTTDVVVYSTVSEYLQDTTVTIIEGEIFKKENEGIVVNEEFLKTVDYSAQAIVGKELSLDFSLNNTDEADSASKTITQQIIGVINDGNPAVVYVSMDSIRNLDISEYSQLRLIIDREENIENVRKQVEILGFQTVSIMDTITDVENLFKYARIALGVVGTIALIISILGMFNTLTVSLLEKTREVGLMKTIGMKTGEIKSLFISESMIMSLLGGILGILLGLIFGFLISLVLSILAMSNGGSYIAVSFLPISVSVGILLMSLLVGFITGLYPSGRAVKMAPLDAIRYE